MPTCTGEEKRVPATSPVYRVRQIPYTPHPTAYSSMPYSTPRVTCAPHSEKETVDHATNEAVPHCNARQTRSACSTIPILHSIRSPALATTPQYGAVPLQPPVSRVPPWRKTITC